MTTGACGLGVLEVKNIVKGCTFILILHRVVSSLSNLGED